MKNNKPSILLIDIETSPNYAACWGVWKQTISPKNIVKRGRTICWAAKWLGKAGVMFDSVYASGMEKMLRGAWDLMDAADAVIYYNGDRFDRPCLQKEWIKYDMALPSPYMTIDLFKTIRSELKIPTGNSMDEALEEFGLSRKLKHAGISLWVKCDEGDPAAWKQMERYNRRDVTVMERLYRKILPAIKSHPNMALFTDDERPCCPKCGSRNMKYDGWRYTKTQKYRRYYCKSCKSWPSERTTALSTEKRRGVLVA